MSQDKGRRQFIKRSGIATVSVLSAGLVPIACAPYKYGQFFVEEDRIRIPKNEFGNKQFLLIQPSGLNAPVLVSKSEENTYNALLMECTHKQCTVAMAGKMLVCPCHGSEYDLQGRVLKSPAEKNLLNFKVSEDESNIYLD